MGLKNTPIKEVMSPVRYDAPKTTNPPTKEMQTEDKMHYVVDYGFTQYVKRGIKKVSQFIV